MEYQHAHDSATSGAVWSELAGGQRNAALSWVPLATLDSSERVQLKPVSIARDLGTVVEIASGLAPSDRVIENPPDGIANGASVHITGSPAAEVAGSKRTAAPDHG